MEPYLNPTRNGEILALWAFLSEPDMLITMENSTMIINEHNIVACGINLRNIFITLVDYITVNPLWIPPSLVSLSGLDDYVVPHLNPVCGYSMVHPNAWAGEVKNQRSITETFKSYRQVLLPNFSAGLEGQRVWVLTSHQQDAHNLESVLSGLWAIKQMWPSKMWRNS